MFIAICIFTLGWNGRCDGEIPRIVWSHWDFDPPEDVQEMIDSQRVSLVNFTYMYLTAENLSSYIDIPPEYKALPENIKGDFVRVAVVVRHGGFWLDASMYCNNGGGMEFFFWKSAQVKSQLTSIGSRFHPWTFFFGAPKNSLYLRLWNAESNKAVKMGLSEYRKRILEERPNDGALRKHDIYFMYDFMMDYIKKTHLKEFKKMSTVSIPISDWNSPYHLMILCERRYNRKKRWDMVVKCYKESLQYNLEVRKFPFIKMGHIVRIGSKLNWEKGKIKPTKRSIKVRNKYRI